MQQARRFPETDLYGITAAEYSQGRDNVTVVRAMLQAGIRIIQYREKTAPKREKYRECLLIRDLCREHDACFIVNDDLDIALAVKADGVHLGQHDLPPEAAREIAGEGFLIGLSTHSPEQADAARTRGVDYIGVGPLYQTFTKVDVGAPVGLGYLDYVVSHSSLPGVAIGGIKRHNVAAVVRHGACCVALVTEIVGAADISARVPEIRAEMRLAAEGAS